MLFVLTSPLLVCGGVHVPSVDSLDVIYANVTITCMWWCSLPFSRFFRNVTLNCLECLLKNVNGDQLFVYLENIVVAFEAEHERKYNHISAVSCTT